MLNPESPRTSQFANLTEDELRQAFLTAANGAPAAANAFWDRFKYVFDLFAGNPQATLNQGIDLLTKCHSIDEAAFRHIHKGTVYYWLGTAAFLANDYELAMYFIDAAAAEDLRRGHDPVNNSTPALNFILAQGAPQAQAARQLVQVMEARLEELLADYNARPGKAAALPPLTLQALRARFLVPAIMPGGEVWRSSATALISFCSEWDYRNTLFDIRPARGTAEPFFLHLFKGCVLFESLIKGTPVGPPGINSTLNPCLQYVAARLAISPNLNIGGADFPSIVAGLATADTSIETCIQFTGKVRNTLGHNLGWVVDLTKGQYSTLFRMISSSCLHAISCLYP